MSQNYPNPAPPEECCQCLLIDEDCFRKTLGPIKLSKNISFEDIWQSAVIAHDIDITAVIGKQCYQDLCARKDTPTYADIALKQAIRKFATWAIYYRFLDSNPSVEVTPVGMVRRSGFDFEQANNDDYQLAVSSAGKYMQMYKREFEAWLKDNADSYPCLPQKENCGCGPKHITQSTMVTSSNSLPEHSVFKSRGF